MNNDITEKIISKIRSYKAYPEDWDGDKGMAPTDEIINDVICFLNKIPEFFIQPTNVAIGRKGIVLIIWDRDNIHIDVFFSGNGKYNYYIRGEIDDYDIPILDNIPINIINLIKD